jgi:hypothetical protein
MFPNPFLFLRVLGDWLYGLLISFFPAEAMLSCGHTAVTEKQPGEVAWCPYNNTYVTVTHSTRKWRRAC